MYRFVKRQVAGMWAGLLVLIGVAGLALYMSHRLVTAIDSVDASNPGELELLRVVDRGAHIERIVVVGGSLLAIALVALAFGRVRNGERRLAALNSELERRVEERTEALRRSAEELRQAQKMEAIGRLAGGVAHDFNNLLSVILGYTEMLADDVEDPALRADITEIHKAGARAAELTRQLLAFSRRQVLAPRVLDLREVLGNMDRLVRRMIGEQIELRVESAAELAHVEVDPGQMEQVIMNLVVNARDAMPGGGALSIGLSNTGSSAGRCVRLSVRDSGVGMDAATRARIFEPFFTTKQTGTGLGLATVFGIVQQSGGAIEVTSSVGKGTTFDIYLPATERPLDRSAAPIPKSQLGHETLLLVEDEDQVRAVARGILGRAGYTVIEARNGEEALELWRREDRRIDLVITDVVMPRMGGRELAERVDKPVLFMSGYTDVAPEGHFLQKPITPTSLRLKVREALANSTSTS